eukprot:GHVN01039396.1.p2 GENE.GHVN01039396.1~~GHVN01039396.1.p2  ORF type:complete len:134 (+),score=71.74 GHVN01039396.1:13-414(+)
MTTWFYCGVNIHNATSLNTHTPSPLSLIQHTHPITSISHSTHTPHHLCLSFHTHTPSPLSLIQHTHPITSISHSTHTPHHLYLSLDTPRHPHSSFTRDALTHLAHPTSLRKITHSLSRLTHSLTMCESPPTYR